MGSYAVVSLIKVTYVWVSTYSLALVNKTFVYTEKSTERWGTRLSRLTRLCLAVPHNNASNKRTLKYKSKKSLIELVLGSR